MLLVVSPAKKLDFESPLATDKFSQASLLEQSQLLINDCIKLSPSDIASLMKLSDKLAGLNAARFGEWSLPFTQDNARQAILSFNGDVYTGLDAQSFSDEDFDFAQQHFRILSGLYGMLRPLDLIQAYRLEMGCRLKIPRKKNLYDFWGSQLTDGLNQLLEEQKTDVIINCASQEYFKSIREKELNGRVVTPVFKFVKEGMVKSPGMMAKRARGMMARFIIQNKIKDVEKLKKFNLDGYKYQPTLSNDDKMEFHRIAG